MTDTATVETLTAEVRVLMVGNRQALLPDTKTKGTPSDHRTQP